MAKGSNALLDLQSFNVDITQREIYLHSAGNEPEDNGVDHRMYSMFHKNIRLLDTINHSPIIVHLNSCGGNWYHGLAIFDAIRLSKSKTIGICYGEASSSASVIMQAFNVRLVAPNSAMLLHHGGQGWMGTSTALISLADNEKRQRQLMLKLLMEKNTAAKYEKMTLEQRMDSLNQRILVNEDVYLLGREIVDEGFADGVFGVDEAYKDYSCLKS